jgi:hypothetical protein
MFDKFLAKLQATCDRNRKDYEFLASLNYRCLNDYTIAQVEADTTAPDPGGDSDGPIGGGGT